MLSMQMGYKSFFKALWLLAALLVGGLPAWSAGDSRASVHLDANQFGPARAAAAFPIILVPRVIAQAAKLTAGDGAGGDRFG